MRVVSAAFAACLLASPALPAAAAEEVDLELVLAVDVSRSMDIREQQVQRDGYVAAFRHPEVIGAIRSGPTGRIAVTYVEWAGPGTPSVVVPWTVIGDADSAGRFASDLASGEISRLRGTSISAALDYSAGLFGANEIASERRVIDISGDGPNNMGVPVLEARDRVLGDGITINGLPVLVNEPMDGYTSIRELDLYYEDCVIGGAGAFLVVVDSVERFAEAIRRKLVLEIAGVEPKVIPAAIFSAEPRIDCMIGERLRERWLRE